MNKANNYDPKIQKPGALITELLSSNPLMATVKLSRYKFVSRMINEDDVLLDIGCGSGLSSHFFSFFCKKVVGIDASGQHLGSWKNLEKPNLKFSQQDVFSLSTEEKVSVIVNLDFIEHFSVENGEKIIETSKDLLQANKKGGMCICGTPSKFSSLYRAPHNREHHLHEYEPEELNELYRKHFNRVLQFSMNDEVVHTGFEKLAWYVFIIGII